MLLRCVMDGHVLAAGVVLPWWLSVVSGMIRGVTDVPPEDPRDALIREQAGQIAALTALVAELREQLDAALRAASRNSGNSSMPPSTG